MSAGVKVIVQAAALLAVILLISSDARSQSPPPSLTASKVLAKSVQTSEADSKPGQAQAQATALKRNADGFCGHLLRLN